MDLRQWCRRSLGQRGTSLPEVVVTIGVISLVTGLSVTGITGRYDTLNSAASTLLNQLRLARMNSITRGAHYRITLSDDTYKLERLQDNDGNGVWDLDTQNTPQEVTVPDEIALSAEGGVGTPDGSSIEFDSRGMLAVPSGISNGVVEIFVTAVAGINAGRVSRIEVWPSGQIQIDD
jgi:Tfp pilus assembly protein FimT